MEIDPWQKYIKMEELGRGAHGVIHRAQLKETGEDVAIKLLQKDRSKEYYEALKRELINHRNLSPHPNVIGFRECFVTKDSLGIVLEYSSGGELFQRVQRAKRFPEQLARFYFQQLISGLSHLHGAGICHRDIKLENTLIQVVDEVPILKICDFGYSKSEYTDSAPHSKVGTMSYVAPEVLKHSRPQYDGKAADIWSAGVFLYIMLVGRYPYDARAHDETMSRIMNAKYEVPSNLDISTNAKDIMSRMMKPNPNQRIRLDQVQKHPFYLDQLPAEIRKGYPPGCGICSQPESDQSVQQIERIVEASRASV